MVKLRTNRTPAAESVEPVHGMTEKIQFDEVARIQLDLTDLNLQEESGVTTPERAALVNQPGRYGRIAIDLPRGAAPKARRAAKGAAGREANQVLIINIQGNSVIVDPLGQCHCPVKPCGV